jgi:hypothetical protein
LRGEDYERQRYVLEEANMRQNAEKFFGRITPSPTL